MTRLLIHGAGGHGKVVTDVLRAAGHQLAGFVDCNPRKLGVVAEPGGGRVILTEVALHELYSRHNELPGGASEIVVAVGNNYLRMQLLEEFDDVASAPLVHPSAIVSAYARLGNGTVVCPRGVVNADTVIGAGVIVNTAAIVEHDCVIGNGVHLSPGSIVCGGVHIGDRSWIGAGATIIQGLVIGTDAVIGAGSVVVRDVADGQTVIGVPARVRQRVSG